MLPATAPFASNDSTSGENFRPWVAILARKAMQEALDGAGVR